MKPDWAEIADCLRTEIAEFGRLLQLLEEQQQLIVRRDPGAVLRLQEPIQDQVGVLEQCRRSREEAGRRFAAAHGRPEAGPLRQLIPLVGPEGRPLMAALVAEISHLVRRVRRGLRLNQRLLSCSVECQQEFMRRVWPSAFTKTYAADGRVSLGGFRREAALQGAG